MSLLNDMLKDLSKKTPHRAVILPAQDSPWVERALSFLPWCIYILLLIFSLTLVQLWFHPKSPVKKATMLESQLVAIPAPTLAGPNPQTEDLAEQEIPRVNEKLVNFSREDWYEEHMNTALEAIQEGNDQRAIDVLSLILTEFATSVEARENLTLLYLSHNDLEHAYEVLNDGLSREPNNLRLITLKARLLAEQGSNRLALQLLEKFNPDINSAPEYYALMAAIFESLGRSAEAGSLYQSLTQIDPDNGQYWLGLGIALEHKHANIQAIEAYRRASESDTSRPTVRAYAANRIKTLRG